MSQTNAWCVCCMFHSLFFLLWIWRKKEGKSQRGKGLWDLNRSCLFRISRFGRPHGKKKQKSGFLCRLWRKEGKKKERTRRFWGWWQLSQGCLQIATVIPHFTGIRFCSFIHNVVLNFGTHMTWLLLRTKGQKKEFFPNKGIILFINLLCFFPPCLLVRSKLKKIKPIFAHLLLLCYYLPYSYIHPACPCNNNPFMIRPTILHRWIIGYVCLARWDGSWMTAPSYSRVGNRHMDGINAYKKSARSRWCRMDWFNLDCLWEKCYLLLYLLLR